MKTKKKERVVKAWACVKKGVLQLEEKSSCGENSFAIYGNKNMAEASAFAEEEIKRVSITIHDA